MMVNFNIDGKTLRKIMETMGSVAAEVALNFDSGGLSVKAMNAERTAMLSIDVSKEAFQTYDGITDGTIGESAGIDVAKAMGSIRMFSPSDVISVSIEKGKITFKSAGLRMSQPAIDPGLLTVPKIPSLSHNNWAVLEANELVRIISATRMVSQTVTMSLLPDAFSVKAVGDVVDETIEASLPRASLKELVGQGPARSTYATELVSSFLKNVSDFGEIRISLATDYPLKMDARAMGGKISVAYVVAPRIAEINS